MSDAVESSVLILGRPKRDCIGKPFRLTKRSILLILFKIFC